MHQNLKKKVEKKESIALFNVKLGFVVQQCIKNFYEIKVLTVWGKAHAGIIINKNYEEIKIFSREGYLVHDYLPKDSFSFKQLPKGSWVELLRFAEKGAEKTDILRVVFFLQVLPSGAYKIYFNEGADVSGHGIPEIFQAKLAKKFNDQYRNKCVPKPPPA